MEMNRRTCLTAVAATLAASATLTGKEPENMKELLEACQNDKKSVMLYFKGQTIGGGVTKVTADTVELRSREYSRVVVKLDSIDAVATS